MEQKGVYMLSMPNTVYLTLSPGTGNASNLNRVILNG